MAISTAGAIVESALKKIGALAAGETMSAEDGQDGLDAFNSLIDQDAAQRLYIYTVTRTTWTIVSGTSTYTVGTGGTVNIARPVYVEDVRVQDTAPSPDLELPLVSLTDDMFQGIPQKEQISTLPTSYYYNPTYPLGTLRFWPVPTSSTLQGVIYAATAVTEFPALTTAISLPPGYRQMYIDRLAADLAPDFGRADLLPYLKSEADESLSIVKAANHRLTDLRFDSGALVNTGEDYGWSIRTGP